MTIDELIALIKSQPENIEFNDVIDTISQYYHYTPSRFTNGSKDSTVVNIADENEGSCKIFYFAQLNQLDKGETLACFGKYYRDDVLKFPDNIDHGNIRMFMQFGWNGICFDEDVLLLRL